MEITKIAEKINKEGGRLYLVGGAVRDEILGKPSYDKDYCVVGINKHFLVFDLLFVNYIQ